MCAHTCGISVTLSRTGDLTQRPKCTFHQEQFVVLFRSFNACNRELSYRQDHVRYVNVRYVKDKNTVPSSQYLFLAYLNNDQENVSRQKLN